MDIILHTSNNEEEHKTLPVSTRSNGPHDSPQTIHKQKTYVSTTKDKKINKTSPSSSSNPQSTLKTLVVSYNIEYKLVEDMKKVKAKISLYKISKLKQ